MLKLQGGLAVCECLPVKLQQGYSGAWNNIRKVDLGFCFAAEWLYLPCPGDIQI